MKSKLLTSLLVLAFIIPSRAQHWVEMMQDPNANYYSISQEFENYWSNHDKNEKGKGYKVFRRWEHFVAPRVYPSGKLSQLALTGKNFEAWQQANKPLMTTGKQKGGGAQIASVTFTPVGPMGPISGNASGQFLKSGRLNFITVNPVNSNDLWVGAPAGGLWHSTNGGTSWTTNTDNLPVTGCSDLAIDPTNTLVMYLATGDGDGGDNRSIGVLKSTNAGQTWTTTGLTANVSSYFLIRRLIINPSNPQILMAATNQGIYRTTNGGTSWVVVSGNVNTFDLEFKPGNPNVVYAGGYSFRVSTNGGQSFSQISTGIPGSTARMAIAVTPADTQYVYVLAGSSANNGFLGMYRSTDAGSTFTMTANTPNLLGWSSTGNDSGGQAYYDLACAASPLNKNEVVTGGVNVWKSTDGGVTWTIYGHWTGTGASFTHADHHDLEYNATGTLYDCNDGTVYRRTSTAWQEISGTMNISQIYRMGLSSLTANKWITGHQDNGTSVWNGTTYNAEIGGDGMDCFISRTNDQMMFGESQYGAMRRTTNGGTNWSSAKSGLPTTDGPWVTVWKQDPVNDDTLYCGYDNLWRSTNFGQTWTSLTSLPSSADITEFAIAPSNNQVIYVVKSTGIYKTINAGSTWTTVTSNVPVGLASPEYICIDPLDANNAWVVLSGYSTGNKVFMTTNGGTSWTNWSSNLPNIPANCCVYHPGSSDRIYVGMDVGIYYRDSNSGSWTLYNSGLPNVPVNELEISPANPGILHAATYGRGVWIVSLASLAPAPPVTSFSVNAIVKCTNAVVTFSDLSTNAPSSWTWSISPGTGYTISSVNAQNPQVTFSTTGIYTVELQADNTIGPGTTSSQTVQVFQTPTVNVIASTQSSICSGTPISFTANGANTYTWSHNGGSGQVANYSPLVSTVYTLTGYSNLCPGVKTMSVNVQPGPSFTISGTSTLCGGTTATLEAGSAPNYSWSTGDQQSQTIVTPTTSTDYSVTSVGANGCKTTKTHYILVSPAPIFTVSASDSLVCVGESADFYAAGANSFTWEPGSVVGYTTTQTFMGPTIFTITGIDHKGCENVTYFSMGVDECVGIKLNSENERMLVDIYPNPADGLFQVKCSSSSVKLHVQVIDVTGKLLFDQNFTTSKENLHPIDLRDYSDGVYMLRLNAEGQPAESIRLIKTR